MSYSTLTQPSKNQGFFPLLNKVNPRPGPPYFEIPHHQQTKSQTCSFWIFKLSLHRSCAPRANFSDFSTETNFTVGTRWISTRLDLVHVVKRHFSLKPCLAVSYFALSWRFVARWKQKRPCSSFQGHLNTVSYVPCQNDINVFITTQWPLLLGGIQLFQQRSLTKATSVLPWPTGHFCWMRKAWETKKKKSNQRYVHTSTPLSLPAYRHVHLTLKFQCGILHIRSARLARNGTTPYLNREIQYSVPLNIKQLYFARGIESFTPAKHFSLPYAWP